MCQFCTIFILVCGLFHTIYSVVCLLPPKKKHCRHLTFPKIHFDAAQCYWEKYLWTDKTKVKVGLQDYVKHEKEIIAEMRTSEGNHYYQEIDLVWSWPFNQNVSQHYCEKFVSYLRVIDYVLSSLHLHMLNMRAFIYAHSKALPPSTCSLCPHSL